MYGRMQSHLQGVLDTIRRDGLFKDERLIAGPQGAHIRLADGREVINFCGNSYLGLSADAAIVQAAKAALDRYGFGLGSVRFICGTQEAHRQLETALAAFLGMDDAILYSSCFDANGGLFEPLFGAEDAIISDELNHASIIDGIRLCKAARFRYRNRDLTDLERQLQAASSARFRIIATDGVFSMDGTVAPLREICDLAERYDALVMVDDSHAVGILGENGRGAIEYCGVSGRVDVVTGTFGKALGGAGGGYTAARREIVELLRQRSRPYLFSNSLSPAVIGASLQALELVRHGAEQRRYLLGLAARFRAELSAAGFELRGADHPIIPVMFGDARLAHRMAEKLLEEGIYVTGFAYPVVPLGLARIRIQLSCAHTRADIDRAIAAFVAARAALC